MPGAVEEELLDALAARGGQKPGGRIDARDHHSRRLGEVAHGHAGRAVRPSAGFSPGLLAMLCTVGSLEGRNGGRNAR